MERVTATAPQNLITKLSLRQRAELASRIFRIDLPLKHEQPTVSAMERSDLVVWILHQPMVAWGCPTSGQIAIVTKLGPRHIRKVIHRVRQWDDLQHVEILIRSRICVSPLVPFTDREISEFYREIRKSIWPWRRGRKACGS